MKLEKLIAFLIILAIYYAVGGDAFPDYSNYITISEKGGYLFLEDEYFFEWISRFWLANVGSIISNHQLSVDIFAALVQLIYFGWLMHDSGDKRYELSKFWITIFLGPLLITTTLRGSPAYLAIFWIAAAPRTWIGAAGASLIALGFHDSALLPIVIYVLARIFSRLDSRPMRIFLLLAGVGVIVAGAAVIQLAVPLLLQLGMGIRAVYFAEITSPSVPKMIYALFIALLCLPLCSKRMMKVEQGFFVLAMFFASALLFALASTPAIRMLLYVFGSALILNFRYHKGITQRFARMSIVQVGVAPMLMAVMFWDLFRNANV
jgi:hypothetical protein